MKVCLDYDVLDNARRLLTSRFTGEDVKDNAHDVVVKEEMDFD